MKKLVDPAEKIELSSGNSDFKSLINNNCFFIDKSLFIKHVLDDKNKVKLILRPKRFGKTLNMSMLYYFLNKDNSKENHKLFDKLEILNTDNGNYNSEFGKYSVIHLSFLNVKASNYKGAFQLFKNVISHCYLNFNHLYEDNGLLNEREKSFFEKVVAEEYSDAEVSDLLRNMVNFLSKSSKNNEVVILIDEYDTPIIESYIYSYYDDMARLFENFFSPLKDTRVPIKFCLMTGIQRISEKGLFSGLNNIAIFNFLDDKSYAKDFGFTEGDVKKLLDFYRDPPTREEDFKKIQSWYSGYRIGNLNLFYPWSVVQAIMRGLDNVSESLVFSSYWVGSTDDSFLVDVIKSYENNTAVLLSIYDSFCRLVNNQKLEKVINQDINFGDIKASEDSLWGFLVLSGYLAATVVDQNVCKYKISIPNDELKRFYNYRYKRWFCNLQPFAIVNKIKSSALSWCQKNNIAQLLNIYIPLDCSNSQNYSEGSRYALNKAVQDFLNDKKQQILLVLGDSGSGKTSLMLKLEQTYWETHSTIENIDGYVPIRIELKSYTTKTISGCIEDTLEKEYELIKEEINQLKKNKSIKMLFIFDGYDEIGGRAEFNLYNKTKLSEWKCEIKSVVTCRSQHFTGEEEFKKHFILSQEETNTKLNESLRVVYLAPFSENQMMQYLIQHSEEYVKKKEANQFPLKEIQELLKVQAEFKSLLSNPFVLKIFSEVAPKLLSVKGTSKPERISKINRAKLYQAFLEDWFFRAKVKLDESIRVGELHKKPKDLERYFFGYAQRLAHAYFKEGITELRYENVSFDEEEYEEYREIGEGNVAFKEFFGSEKPEVVEARKACPLRRSGESTYSFVHKSFQDYLAARHLYLVLKSGNEKLIIENWNTRYLSEDRAVLRFISEIIEGDAQRKKLEEQLLQIIQSSSQSEAIDTASSNMISVLNWNRYSFSGMNLEGIRIPKSYLEGVNFSGANLRKSNLKGSYVTNSEWSEVNLGESDLRGLVLGEYPDWEQGSAVRCLVFNAMGTLLATGDDEGYLRLWRYPGGELLRSWEGHRGYINSVSFSLDSKRLASGGDDNTIRIWEVESGLEERALLGHTGIVMSVSFSSDGKRLASGGYDGTIRIWVVSSGLEERTLLGHTGIVMSVNFSSNGKRLASGSEDKTIRIWEVESGLEERALRGHTHTVESVSWSIDGERLASGGDDNTIRIWGVLSGLEERALRGHTNWVTSVSFSSDGKRLASGGYDGTIRIWEFESGLEKRVLRGHAAYVTSVSFSSDGKRLASGSEDKTIRIWEVESGLEERERALRSHTNRVRSVSWSIDGERLASGGDDNTIRIWEFESGLEKRALRSHTNWVTTSVSFSSDGKRLASGGYDGTIRIWEFESGLEKRVLRGHTGYVTSVSFSSDGKRLASGGWDNTIRIWRQSGLEEQTLRGHKERVTSVSWSVDGKRLASGGGDGTIRVWLLESGLEERALIGHTGYVTSVSFSSDGKRLASGSGDGTIRVWLVENGSEERALRGHTAEITSVSFSLDGKRLASGSWDKMIRIWEVESGQCTEVSVFNQIVSSVVFCQSCERKEKYLAAGIGNGVYVFSVKQSDLNAKPLLILKWRTEYYLRAQNASLENAKIDPMNRRLLEQRGAKKSKIIASESAQAMADQGLFPKSSSSSSESVVAEALKNQTKFNI